MVPMPIVRPALKGDITKLEADFFNGYCDGDRVFYISATDSKGYFQFMDNEVRVSWSPNWAQTNAVFESQLDTDLSLVCHIRTIYFLYGMAITYFLLGGIILTAYILKIMNTMSLWILSFWRPSLTTFQVC
jgi:hypothetical protein